MHGFSLTEEVSMHVETEEITKKALEFMTLSLESIDFSRR